jgi:hypothetical protein
VLVKKLCSGAKIMQTSSVNPVNKHQQSRKIEVTVQNLAPARGTIISNLWVGFHDGTFRSYSLGAPAPKGLEGVAEDANTGPISNEFNQSDSGVVQGTLFGSDDVFNNIAPGSTVKYKFVIDSSLVSSRYFSYAAMVIPSNDAFIANENPLSLPLFDEEENFVGTDFIVFGSDVLDAGTEVNDESPLNAAGGSPPPIFFRNTGLAENGVVRIHPGYIAGGPFLINPAFANANFKVEGYRVARITVKEI